MQDQSLRAALEQHTKNAYALGIAAGRREVFDEAYAAAGRFKRNFALVICLLGVTAGVPIGFCIGLSAWWGAA